MGILLLTVVIGNHQVISIRSVNRLQRLQAHTSKEVCTHQECKHSTAFDNTQATYHIS